MDDAARDKHLEAVKRDGFTIVENAIEPELIDALNDALARLVEALTSGHLRGAGRRAARGRRSGRLPDL